MPDFDVIRDEAEALAKKLYTNVQAAAQRDPSQTLSATAEDVIELARLVRDLASAAADATVRDTPP